MISEHMYPVECGQLVSSFKGYDILFDGVLFLRFTMRGLFFKGLCSATAEGAILKKLPSKNPAVKQMMPYGFTVAFATNSVITRKIPPPVSPATKSGSRRRTGLSFAERATHSL